jgi:hypothetical protein
MPLFGVGEVAEFFTNYVCVPGRFNADSHGIGPDSNNGDHDFVADTDPLTGFSGQHQHGTLLLTKEFFPEQRRCGTGADRGCDVCRAACGKPCRYHFDDVITTITLAIIVANPKMPKVRAIGKVLRCTKNRHPRITPGLHEKQALLQAAILAVRGVDASSGLAWISIPVSNDCANAVGGAGFARLQLKFGTSGDASGPGGDWGGLAGVCC